MAISTTYKRQEELAKQQAPVGSNSAYSGMKGVSQNTANNLGNYQSGYKPGDQASAAQAQLQQVQAQKPQGYNSKYGAQLDSILQQIQNPGQFKYEFNGDNLFKYYADKYVQQGKQASMDTMGQAAALTGGYGNSYGQQVGQQTYQQYLMDLYNVGLDLRDRAYQQHQDQLGNQKDAYGLMNNAEQQEYGMYRDTVGDWENERAFAAQQAENERNFDYDMYQNDLNYWTGMAQNENAAYNTEADRAEGQRQFDATNKLNYDKLAEDQRQFDASLSEEQRQYNRNVAMDYVSSILANGQIPSTELLIAAGLSYEDAMKLLAEVSGGSGGSGGDEKPTQLSGEELATPANYGIGTFLNNYNQETGEKKTSETPTPYTAKDQKNKQTSSGVANGSTGNNTTAAGTDRTAASANSYKTTDIANTLVESYKKYQEELKKKNGK